MPVILFLFAFIPFHHGWADYDQKKGFEFTGDIQEFVFENPHATLKLKGEADEWLVILAPTSRMNDRGVPIDKLQKGNKGKVYGYPHKTGKKEMRAERIFVDDVKFELR